MDNDRSKRTHWHPETQMVRGGTMRSGFQETGEALYLTSGYVYDRAEDAEAAFAGDLDRFVYSRFGNPTVAMFEERMTLLEGAEDCRATATGMAAMFGALACFLKSGDRVVASRALFGSCQHILNNILPGWGITTTYVDPEDLNQWEDALKTPAQAVFLETPSNPGLALVDVPAVCALAKKAGAATIVDNVFATAVLQKPLEMGADIVAYSTTKHIDGQGRCLGGAVLSSKKFIEEKFTPFLRNTGPSISPFNAWVMLKGLETVDMRVTRMCENALAVARHLETRGLSRVLYPFLDSHPQADLARKQMKMGGSVVSFEVNGGRDAAFALLNALEVIDISNNLGDAKSLITHPASTTHFRLSPEDKEKQGITPGFIRLSVGLEHPDDLIRDLDQALARI